MQLTAFTSPRRSTRGKKRSFGRWIGQHNDANKILRSCYSQQHTTRSTCIFASNCRTPVSKTGTIESGESAGEAAIRELAEEAGILDTKILSNLGLWNSGYQEQIWSFHLCEVDHEMPDEWVHQAFDDGGHDFNFFLVPSRASSRLTVARGFSGSLGFHSHRSSTRLKPFASLTGVSEAPPPYLLSRKHKCATCS